MKKLQEINEEIRDFIRDKSIITIKEIEKNKISQEYFYSGMDIIDDTCLALDNFSKIKNNDFLKTPYLLTYGILQSLVMQQDAVSFLKKSILNKTINFNKDEKFKELKEIRFLRNETIGHPISTDNKKRLITTSLIIRHTMSREGFEYSLYEHEQQKTKFNIKVDFEEIIKKQEDELIKEMKVIFDEIMKKENKYKKQFKNKKIFDLLHKSYKYHLRKLYELKSDKNSYIIIDLDYKILKDNIENIFEEIEKRYLSMEDRIPGTFYLKNEIDYLFEEILKKYENKDKTGLSLIVECLESKIEELKKHLKEIDKDF